MKMPAKPPPFGELMQGLTAQELASAFSQASATYGGRYLHWDKLRRMPPPDKLDHTTWWLRLKIARMGTFRQLPLRDAAGIPFLFAMPDPIPQQLHWLDQRAGGSLATDDPIVNPDMRNRYLISSLIEESIRSSQLEGAHTTARVAREMIRSQRKPRDKHERMILNNYHTMQQIRKLRATPLTPEIVYDLHARLTRDTLDDPDMAGRPRDKDDIRVVDDYGEVFHQPPPHEQLNERMGEICRFANDGIPGTFIHPVIRAIVLHFWLAYDHPFVDGNGRCARALFYWSMLRHDYWLLEFISISSIINKAPKRYYRAFLHSETDENDLTYFALYHLEVISKAVEQLNQYVQRKTEQIHRLEARLRLDEDLNYRQQALLTHAIRHSGARYTFESHQTSHNVAYQTARTDLLQLVKLGLLTARKRSRRWYFSPAADIEERLSGTAGEGLGD